MEFIVQLYSNQENEINRFLKSFFYKDTNFKVEKNSILEWEKKYQNPFEIVDIIGTFIENSDKFKINMWISLDKDTFINITDDNADTLIRYIYERYPW